MTNGDIYVTVWLENSNDLPLTNEVPVEIVAVDSFYFYKESKDE